MIDSPEEASQLNPKYLGLIRDRLPVLVEICRAPPSADVVGTCISCGALVGGAVINDCSILVPKTCLFI